MKTKNIDKIILVVIGFNIAVNIHQGNWQAALGWFIASLTIIRLLFFYKEK